MGDGRGGLSSGRCDFKEQASQNLRPLVRRLYWQAGPARFGPTRVVCKSNGRRRAGRIGDRRGGRREGAYGAGAPRAPLQERSLASSIGCPRLRPATERLPWLPMFQPAVRTRPRPCWNFAQYRTGFGRGDKWVWRAFSVDPGLRRDDIVEVGRAAEMPERPVGHAQRAASEPPPPGSGQARRRVRTFRRAGSRKRRSGCRTRRTARPGCPAAPRRWPTRG